MEIFDEIDIQLKKLLTSRAIFPYMTDDLTGHHDFSTAPFYRIRGYNINFHFNQPLTKDKIREYNSIGHWINQNYLIRLNAFLEYKGIIPKEGQGHLDQTLEGFDDIDLLRRLRGIFAHTSGRYNSSVSEEVTLYRRIIDHYSLDDANLIEENEYPIPIDKVIIPLTEGCKKYIQAVNNTRGI